jgi:hypothetical protein
MITAFVNSNSSGLISQSALFVRGGGIVFGSKWLPVFPCRKKNTHRKTKYMRKIAWFMYLEKTDDIIVNSLKALNTVEHLF